MPGSNDVVRVVTYRPELGLFVYLRESERRWNEVFDCRSQAAGCRGCVGAPADLGGGGGAGGVFGFGGVGSFSSVLNVVACP